MAGSGWNRPTNGLVSPDYVVASYSDQLSSEYISYLMRTELFSSECGRASHGITWDRLRLYWEGFREIRIPVPSRNEQDQIVTAISSKVSKLEALRSSAEKTIDLLKERRAALIAAAVTGQLVFEEPTSTRTA